MEKLWESVITASGLMAILFLCWWDICILKDSGQLWPKGIDLDLVAIRIFYMFCTKIDEKDLTLLSFLKYRARVQSLLFSMGYRLPDGEQ